MSILNAVSVLNELETLDRRKTQVLFVLAILNAKHGYPCVAKGYAEECILLLRRIGTDSYEECATNIPSLGGVLLPELLHEEVVRERLKFFKIELAA